MKNFSTVRKIIPGLLFCLTFLVKTNSEAQVSSLDSSILVEFYFTNNGPNWVHHDNWLITPVKQWYGVALTFDNHNVFELFLPNNNLCCTVSPLLCNLPNLAVILLPGNNLTGQIPECYGYVQNLNDLNLENNHLTNPIPLSLGNSDSNHLGVFRITNNDFYGHFPDTLMKSQTLYNLGIANNNFISPIFHPANLFISAFGCAGNKFTFQDILPFVSINSLGAWYMDSVLNETDTTIAIGSNLILDSWVDTCNNRYSWWKNGAILNYHSNNPHWTISNAQIINTGDYTCDITNNGYTPLTLHRKIIHVHVANNIGTGDNHSPPSIFNIQFNITQHLLNVSLNLHSQEKISAYLYDEAGRNVLCLFNGFYQQQEFHFYLGWMKKGLYFVRIMGKDEVSTRKIIIY